MHLGDDLVANTVCWATGGLAAGGVAMAALHLRRARGAQQPTAPACWPIIGAAAALIFAAQMVQYPVGHGVSGHLIGGALAGILLGPAAAVLCLSLVLAVQCLVFGDGGPYALGANILNMAIVAPLCGVAANHWMRSVWTGRAGRLAGAAFAGWLSVVAASLACAAELAISGTYGIAEAALALGSIHARIGLGEASIAAGCVAVAAWLQQRAATPAAAAQTPRFPLVGPIGLMALGLACLAPLGAQTPDGLEWTIQSLGAPAATGPTLATLMPDYRVGGLANASLATALAGGIGVIGICAGAWLISLAGFPSQRVAEDRR